MLKKLKVLFKSTLLLAALLIVSSCDKGNKKNTKQTKADYYHDAVKALTDAIVYDIFSPPVASRIYAYPNIAAYEVLVKNDTNAKSFSSKLTGLSKIPEPQVNADYDYGIAALKAFTTVAKELVFSREQIETYETEFIKILQTSRISPKKISNSMTYGTQVGHHILAWAEQDKYKETRTYSKYTVLDQPDKWKPTPPDYMDGIEPHWNKIRPFVIDSASQFQPLLPTKFSMDSTSLFYKELKEVYVTGNNLNEEQVEIAKFWDCNPYVTHHKGHAMFATKKITPGGHWINITAIAGKKNYLNLMETVEAYTKVSVVLADAFISCWDEKWNSLLVRPETLINEYWDEDWQPLLQTPPFPEYTSGHSVVSGAASVMLTDIFGDNFEFNDTSEIEYGLPARSFKSFYEAADEAAISRLYGGIHYMPAITNGLQQGKEVGEYVVKNLNKGL